MIFFKNPHFLFRDKKYFLSHPETFSVRDTKDFPTFRTKIDIPFAEKAFKQAAPDVV